MNPKMLILAVGAIVIIAGSAFLLTKNSTNVAPEMGPTPTTAIMMEETPAASPSTTMIDDAMSQDEVREIIVEGSNFKFAPTAITVKKGEKVKLVFKNSGGMHDFVVDELDVRTKIIASGATDTVEFTASEVGTFEFYCSVGTHRAMGMVGKITVTE